MKEEQEIEMKKFPKIGQFRDAVYEVRRRLSYQGQDENDQPIYHEPASLPSLTFRGSVKLHGTNAAIRFVNGEVVCQSRNRVITTEDDNQGFAQWCVGNDIASELLAYVPTSSLVSQNEDTIFYGEFCGGNIQKGVAISQLPKMFVVFAVKTDKGWITPPSMSEYESKSLKVISYFDQWVKTIPLSTPEQVINEMVELTQSVEDCCPVGKELGVEGIGEGIVWQCLDEGWQDIRFKTKGEKHSKSKVKTLSPADAEKAGKVRSFAQSIMTEGRLEQGMEFLTESNLEHSRKSTGAYLKYVVSDCLVEEKIAIEESRLTSKEVGKELSNVAKVWFFEKTQ